MYRKYDPLKYPPQQGRPGIIFKVHVTKGQDLHTYNWEVKPQLSGWYWPTPKGVLVGVGTLGIITASWLNFHKLGKIGNTILNFLYSF